MSFTFLSGAILSTNTGFSVPGYILPSEVERELGIPVSNGDILSSNTDGSRYWVARSTLNVNAAVFSTNAQFAYVANNANYLQGYTWSSPASIGSVTSNTAAFTNTTVSSVSFLTFDPSDVPSRTLHWNKDEGSLEFQINGTHALHVGQDHLIYAVANGNIQDGQVVMYQRASGELPVIIVADVNNELFAPNLVLGVASHNINSGQKGYVTVFGKVAGANTRFFQAGARLYLDPLNPGGFTETEPEAPNYKIEVARVLRVDDAGEGVVLVHVHGGYKLGDLHNIHAPIPANNDYLAYNSTLSRWENKPQPIGYAGSRGFTGSIGYTGSKGDLGFVGSLGFTGSRGETGFIGSIGFTGSLGFTGSQGIQGFTGSIGFTGSVGFTGSQGIQGFTGSQGIQGFDGSQGVVGFIGSRGDTGFIGSQGDLGYTGSRGTDGTSVSIIGSVADVNAAYPPTGGPNDPQGLLDYYFPSAVTGNGVIDQATGELWVYDGSAWDDVGTIVGPQGDLGYTGSIGFTGSRGQDGIIGVDGYIGSQGQIGFTGSQGAGFTGSQGAGFTGSAGTDGFTGSIGFTGSQGAGFTGSAGTSGSNGFTGSQGAGFTGSAGTDGFTGSIGFTGSQGEVGFSGSQGEVGFTGSIGLTGSRGFQGNDGFTGSQGVGFTGSIGGDGFTGSIGFTGSTGFVGSASTVPGPQGPAGLSFTSSVNVSSNTTASTQTLYILTANVTLTFPATPANFDYVGITNLSGFPNSTVARNGEKIMSLSEDLTIDVSNGGFTLFYSGSTSGWIIL